MPFSVNCLINIFNIGDEPVRLKGSFFKGLVCSLFPLISFFLRSVHCFLALPHAV